MSASALAASTAAEGPSGALAAAERMQRLQSLIAQVERGPTAFAAALDAAQSAPSSTATAAGASAQEDASDPAAASYAADASPATAAAALYSPGAASDTLYTGIGAGSGPSTAAYQSSSVASPATDGDAAIAPSTALGGAASAYTPLIEQAAARNGVDPAVLSGLIQQESGFDPGATSSAGALGLTQLMPATASSLGVTDPLDPAQSIEGGARYLGQLLRQFAGNTADALAAYNAGPGAVQRYGGVPPYPETQAYVSKVLANAAAYRASAGAGAAPSAPATAASATSASGGAPATAGTLA